MGLYLSSKAASRRASRMFSSGSQVLYLEGIRKKWESDPGTGKEQRVCVYMSVTFLVALYCISM